MDSTRQQPEGFRSPNRWNTVPVPERVATRAITKVDVQDDGCWISQYSVASHGYAQIGWQVGKKVHMVLAHRAAWVSRNGQVPVGMTIDHLCKVRRCVNPDHLRLLSNFENARRTNGEDFPLGQCRNGHPNSSLVPVTRTKRGVRRRGLTCGECMREARARWLAANPEKRAETLRRYYEKKRKSA